MAVLALAVGFGQNVAHDLYGFLLPTEFIVEARLKLLQTEFQAWGQCNILEKNRQHRLVFTQGELNFPVHVGRRTSARGKKDGKHIGSHDLLGNFILPLLGGRYAIIIPKIQIRFMKMTHGIVDQHLVRMSITDEGERLASRVRLERDWNVR